MKIIAFRATAGVVVRFSLIRGAQQRVVFESGFTGFSGLTITSLVGVGRSLLDGDIISLSFIVYASANSMLINF
jgi:hypothetical protein